MSIKIGYTRLPGGIPEIICMEPEKLKLKTTDDVPSRWKPAFCPAVQAFIRNTYVVRSPVDLHIKVKVEDEAYKLQVLDGEQASVGVRDHGSLLSLSNKNTVNDPEKPVIQINDGCIFFADEPVLMEQLPPVYHYTPNPLPGVMVMGQFDIYSWQRPLNWALEIHDTSKNIRIKRGDPLYYAKFTSLKDHEKKISLKYVEPHRELVTHIRRLMGSQNYVRNSFSLFSLARARRPKKLVR